MGTYYKSSAWFNHCSFKTNARLRLFCFPHAGGGASQFRLWGEKLPSFIDVCPIQLPGREERISEPPFTRLADLLPPLKEALEGYLDRPFAFFGHSMGALISFELTRAFRWYNLPLPQRLFASACRAPQLLRGRPDIHQLPDAEFITAVRDIAGTPEGLFEHAEIVALFLPILRADFALCEDRKYTADDPFPSAISAFGGIDDDTVSSQELDAWRGQTTGSFTRQMFPGNHFYLRSSEAAFLQAMGRELLEC